MQTFVYDEDDKHVLLNSYNSIKSKSNVSVVHDIERKCIVDKILNALTFPNNSTFSVVNLFKIAFPSKEFYLSHCLIDYGFPVSAKLAQSYDRVYNFQIVGYGTSSIDLGNTFVRKEIKSDKWFSFFTNDVDIEGADVFNDKYYLISSKKKRVMNAFDIVFCNAMSKADDLLLKTNGTDIFLTFGTNIRPVQTSWIEDIFLSCNFLSITKCM